MLEQFIITFQILIIDVVMAADNAIIIGIIAANFAPENRRKIIAWGVAAAFLFRIVCATGANFIFEFAIFSNFFLSGPSPITTRGKPNLLNAFINKSILLFGTSLLTLK